MRADNNSILSFEEIKDKLKDRRLYIVAKHTGLSYPTLKKLSRGLDFNYTLNTLKTISEYLAK